MLFMWLAVPFICVNLIQSIHAAGKCTQQFVKRTNQIIVNCDNLALTKFPTEEIPLNVTDLYIRFNSLSSLDKNLSVFTELKSLYLSSNNFISIPDIDSLNMAILVLDHNQIKNVSLGPGFNCPKLRQLTLSSCKITSVAENAFMKTGNLQTLLLNDNELRYIHPKAFAGGKNIKSLKMHDCSNVANGSLSDLVQTLSPLENLVSLDLSASLIQADGYNLSSATFPTTSSSFIRSLQFLFLDRNNIPHIGTDSFKAFTALKTLTLVNSQIAHIDPTAFSAPKLLELQLDGNLFEDIPAQAFSGLSSLITLSLNGNAKLRLMEPNSFQGLTSLKNLSLNNLDNFFAIPSSTFEGLTSLSKLSLAAGKLASIQKNAFSPFKESLFFLDVSYQLLSDFSGGDNKTSQNFTDLKALTNLNIFGNPFNCSCELNGGFIAWIHTTHVNITNVTRMMCATPENMRNLTLTQVDCSTSSVGKIVLLIILTFVVCALLSVGGVAFFIMYLKSRSRSSTVHEDRDHLLNTEYARDDERRGRLHDCLELLPTCFRRGSDPTAEPTLVEEESLGSQPGLDFRVCDATRIPDADVLLLCHNEEAAWSRSLLNVLSPRLPSGLNCQVWPQTRPLSPNLVQSAARCRVIVVLSVGLIRAQNTAEVFSVLVNLVSGGDCPVLVRKSFEVIRTTFTNQAESVGLSGMESSAFNNANAWIECHGEADMGGLIQQLLGQMNYA